MAKNPKSASIGGKKSYCRNFWDVRNFCVTDYKIKNHPKCFLTSTCIRILHWQNFKLKSIVWGGTECWVLPSPTLFLSFRKTSLTKDPAFGRKEFLPQKSFFNLIFTYLWFSTNFGFYTTSKISVTTTIFQNPTFKSCIRNEGRGEQ